MKLDIRSDIAKRKYKKPNIFSYLLYALVNKTPLLGGKYHPNIKVIDKVSDCKTGAFVIWNHQSRRDHCFITEACFPRRISIVAEYNSFFRSHLHSVFKAMKIIPKKIYCNDIVGIRAIRSVIKQGGLVAFSPEGTSSIFGDNQPIVPGTGRFLQAFNVPIYIVSLKGSYLTNNKVTTEDRIGKVYGEMKLLYSSDELKKTNPIEIERRINEEFHHDDYLWNKKMHIKYKNNGSMTTNLHHILYKCPRCGKEFEMEAKSSYIKCNACGYGASMDEYYDFHPFKGSTNFPFTPSEWVKMERKNIIDEIRKNPQYEMKFPVKLGYLPNNHFIKDRANTEICGEGVFVIDHQGVHFKGKKLNEPFSFDLDYKYVYSFPMSVDLSMFSLYVNEENYDFLPYEPLVGKAIILVQEMHRLHINTFKNFPWFDDLYVGKELGIDLIEKKQD